MLKELFESVSAVAAKAALPTTFRPTAEPDHVYYLVDAHKAPVRCEAEPPPRAHQAGDLIALIEIMRRHLDGSVLDSDPAPVLWYNRSRVVLLLDDGTRRDKVTLPLVLHPQLLILQQLEERKTFLGQKDFLRLLRIGLSGCLGAAGNLLDVVRQVKFKQGMQGESSVQHGKSSLGRTIPSELTVAGTIPEQVVLSVPAFAGPLSLRRYAVECAIEVDMRIDSATETFQLVPLPGAVEAALCAAEATLGEELRVSLGEEARIHYGTP